MTDKKEIATEQELADFLIYHINNPCTEPRTGLNIRYFYIREARRALEKFDDLAAKTKLEETIAWYSGG